MTPEEFRARVARWQDPHTEFKQALGSTSELAKDLVCFANSDGGQIVVGIADSGAVVGVDDVDTLLLRVDDVAFQRCSPPVTVVPETVELDERPVVVLHVAKGEQRPYATQEGRYYVRSGARCRAASREELLRLFQATQTLFYDEQPLTRLGLSALDLDAVIRYLGEGGWDTTAEDIPRVLRAWRMYDGAHPTVGGLVVFGRRPQGELISTAVVAAAFPGTDTGGDLADRTDLTGDLFEVAEQIEQFLRLHLRSGHHVVGFERERTEEIPRRGDARGRARDPQPAHLQPGRRGRARHPSRHRDPTDHALLRESSGADLGISISDAEVVLRLPRP